MSTDTATLELLLQTLLNGTREAGLLLELLDAEYRLLQGTDSEALEKLTQQKQQQIVNLEAAVARQDDFLEQRGLQAGREGMQAYLATFPSDSPVGPQWQAFTTKLTACRKQNEINGALLNQSRRQISHALELLRGICEADKTYGPSGEARSNQSANSLGKA